MIEHQIPELGQREKQTGKWIVLSLGLGCAFLACAALIVALIAGFTFPGLIPQSFSRANEVPRFADQKPNSMGDPNAPVKIIEYGDFQCPYCLRFWQDTEPQLIETYIKTGKVYFEYRSVGGFLGHESAAAAEAAYCAGDQGKFWEYHNTLFANWGGENTGNYSPEKLNQYADIAGLDGELFNTCLTDGTFAARVEQDMLDAHASGVHATPSFVINGKLLIEGAQPFHVFQEIIEKEINGDNHFQNGELHEESLDAHLFERFISLTCASSLWT